MGKKLHHLRVIAALSDLKLLARVAEELNITQPAVSKQIAELEKRKEYLYIPVGLARGVLI